MQRKPAALANWKMAMTAAESLAFVRDFQTLAEEWLDQVEVIICPPFTALWPTAQSLGKSPLQLGSQNIAASTDPARTGEISAALVAETGCRWVMLGHWEVRRHLGDDEATINSKVHLALEANLAPILFIGESQADKTPLEEALERQLSRVLAGCRADQVASMLFLYEPEGAIGVTAPASPEHVAAGCGFIREQLRRRWDEPAAEAVRILYGGSVTPEHAAALLACPDVDGLGATRRGRDPATFAAIVQQIAERSSGEAHLSEK